MGLQELVNRATSDMLIQADWDTNFKIIEAINNDPARFVFFFTFRPLIQSLMTYSFASEPRYLHSF